MMDPLEFDRLVRDALSSLFDTAALETHALNSVFTKPALYPGRRAEYLRQVLVEAIEALQPERKESKPGSVEWRSYLVLTGRYVEGMSLLDLQNQLGLSERQLRREHSRAVSALVIILWDRAFPNLEGNQIIPGQDDLLPPQEPTLTTYQVVQGPLDLSEVISGIKAILTLRLVAEDAELILDLPADSPLVVSERVILRQILLSLLGYAIHERSQGDIHLRVSAGMKEVVASLQFYTDEESVLLDKSIQKELESVEYWGDRIHAGLTFTVSPQMDVKAVEFSLALPKKELPVILVADDHEAAIQLVRRYLHGSGFQVMGVQEPDQVLAQTLKLHPQAVLLDVMMPSTDGWEILQSLKANPETAPTPVLICSVWNEPELAYSLGATDYLKKPFTQQDLLQALARLNSPDTSGEAGLTKA